MPKFLTQDEIYRMLQRESPEGVYPDGEPSLYYSTAEMYSVAKTLETAYQKLERIYENYFPQTADENLTDWEETVFGFQLDSSLTLQERRDRVLAKIRSQRRCTPPDILATVYTVVNSDIPVEIVEWGCEDGTWILDESQLDISTILNGPQKFAVTGDAISCPITAAQFGITQEELEAMQEEAYTYEVRIYGYTLTALELMALEKALLEAEPARSQHIISDGLDPNDMIEGDS